MVVITCIRFEKHVHLYINRKDSLHCVLGSEIYDVIDIKYIAYKFVMLVFMIEWMHCLQVKGGCNTLSALSRYFWHANILSKWHFSPDFNLRVLMKRSMKYTTFNQVSPVPIGVQLEFSENTAESISTKYRKPWLSHTKAFTFACFEED